MLLAVGILAFFGQMSLDLYTDLKKALHGGTVNHRLGAIIRVGTIIPSVVLLTICHPGNFFWVLLNVVLMEFFCYVFLFNGLFNLFRKEPWWTSGTTSDLDKLWNHIGLRTTQIVQISGLVIFTAIYILTFFLN